MLRDQIGSIVASAIDALIASGLLPEAVRGVPIEILDTKQPEHGDFACNFALAASKKAGMNPRQVAETLKTQLATDTSLISEIEIAGPGFINLRLKSEAVAAYVDEVLRLGDNLPNSKPAHPQKINIEFVSVNPNGPITIGSGRGAAYGSALSKVLEAAGNTVHREYYINDGVNSEQMRLFAESVIALTEGRPVPEKGYKGDYVADIASQVEGATWIDGVLTITAADGSTSTIQVTERPEDPTEWIRIVSEQLMIARQRKDLSAFGVNFDTWFSEQSLHVSGEVLRLIDDLEAKGAADASEFRVKIKLAKGGKIEDVEREPQVGTEPQDEDEEPSDPTLTAQRPTTQDAATLWLRSTKFGDDMDRVLRRKDGRLTYIASDVAYHKDKFNRPANADKLITVLGPDHHGYIARLEAVVAALLMQPATPDAERAPLSEFEEKIYTSPEDRDACHAALAEAKRKLEVQIFQLVRFVKDGQPAPMRKRDGNIYALIDLIKEIGQTVKPQGTDNEKLEAGRDVARFFYLMRSHDTTLDFDLDLAAKQSDENPVFYVQYAHARICSVLRKAGVDLSQSESSAQQTAHKAQLLTQPKELNLIKKIVDLPWEVQRSAEDYGVHRLTTYAVELARTFHNFYDACRVIQPDQPELTQARLALCQAARIGLKATLDLLGISAPERMDREEPVPSSS